MSKQFDIYQMVTDRVLTALANGTIPWTKPWKGGAAELPFNASTKRPYRGANIPMLWVEQMVRDYPTAGWMTFNQARALKGSVRKGEKGTPVIYWKRLEKKELNPKTGKEEVKKSFFLRYFTVFNVAQIENLPERFYKGPVVELNPEERNARIDAFLKASGANFVEKLSDRAFYSPVNDSITMPKLGQFKSAEHYYSTALHELTHWTAGKGRSERELGMKGTPEYAFEELVAEMGSAFLCAYFQLPNELQHESYVSYWMEQLKADKKAFLKACTQSQRAVDFLLELCGENKPEDDEAE